MSTLIPGSWHCARCMLPHPGNTTCEAAADHVASFTNHAKPILERDGTKHVPLPDGAGKLNCATVFNDKLFIGCENGMWVRSNEGTWERISV